MTSALKWVRKWIAGGTTMYQPNTTPIRNSAGTMIRSGRIERCVSCANAGIMNA